MNKVRGELIALSLNNKTMKGAIGLDKAKRIRTLPEIQRILDAIHGRVFY